MTNRPLIFLAVDSYYEDNYISNDTQIFGPVAKIPFCGGSHVQQET